MGDMTAEGHAEPGWKPPFDATRGGKVTTVITWAINAPMIAVTLFYNVWFVLAAFLGWAVRIPGGELQFQPSIVLGVGILVIGSPILWGVMRLVSMISTLVIGVPVGLLVNKVAAPRIG